MIYCGPGITQERSVTTCLQCGSIYRRHIHSYYSPLLQRDILYCRYCLQLGRMDSLSDVYITQTYNVATSAEFNIPFKLSPQQHYGATALLEAVKSRQDQLLHAVTGAGKTEMMFPALQYARQQGLNVAVVSPRTDVVIELTLRLRAAFQQECIDVLYRGQPQRFNGHFVIATVHQLLRFKQHFQLVIVDEVDAFPLAMDRVLQHSITLASTHDRCHIYMTATPPKSLLRQFKASNIITLPARFHRQPLPIPQFQYFKLTPQRPQTNLVRLLCRQQAAGRITLVFVHSIKLLRQLEHTYQKVLVQSAFVSSDDALRMTKVQELRAGKYVSVFTTTILERGFTLAKLDIVVLNSHTFTQHVLIQMSGRVGHKTEAPTGNVWFYHQGISTQMLKAKHALKRMNRIAQQRGWIDG